MATKFAAVYNRFLGKITDDMYMELTPQDTLRDLQGLLEDAIPGFEFPRKKLDYIISTSGTNSKATDGFLVGSHIDNSYFLVDLTSEEINILAILMMCGWLQRQVTTIENIRMKYSGTDFKMTSQANHLSKLLTLLAECQRQSHHLQRLYKRRKIDEHGYIRSNWSVLRENSALNNSNILYEDPVDEMADSDYPSKFIFNGGVIQ